MASWARWVRRLLSGRVGMVRVVVARRVRRVLMVVRVVVRVRLVCPRVVRVRLTLACRVAWRVLSVLSVVRVLACRGQGRVECRLVTRRLSVLVRVVRVVVEWLVLDVVRLSVGCRWASARWLALNVVWWA